MLSACKRICCSDEECKCRKEKNQAAKPRKYAEQFCFIQEKITNIKDKLWRFCLCDDSRLVIFAVVAIHWENESALNRAPCWMHRSAATLRKSGVNEFLSPKISTEFYFHFPTVYAIHSIHNKLFVGSHHTPLCHSTGDAILCYLPFLVTWIVLSVAFAFFHSFARKISIHLLCLIIPSIYVNSRNTRAKAIDVSMISS